MNKDQAVRFRCSLKEIIKWERAAREADMTTSAWIRAQCNAGLNGRVGESALAAKKNGKAKC